ncbi:hypothetical protein [Paraburkholderia gardini]|uniref:hypothetical protein n=1 Tax=Paraburkholderia gardini TaxID=2823469 RepID=UPI001E0224B5|nr:hypothetical protein [Paraburkholderia gardini]CAG4889597.1 hypothetical protein R69919_00779 [Paraburkholderia gardini]
MSRSGYSDDYDWLNLWRGAVERSIRGKRGQTALQELAAALDAMTEKTLAAESLVTEDGEFCTLGVLGQARGLNMKPLDPEDWDAVAKAFNMAPAMVREIVYENDEVLDDYKWVDVEIYGPVRPYERHIRSVRIAIPEEVLGPQRWQRMRQWVESNLVKEAK